MSVAHLTTQELACFVAIAHKHLKAGPIAKLCKLAEIASSGNSGAYTAQYGEPADPSTATEIEGMALDYLADRRDMVADHFGPITYNMVTNNGVVYATQYTTTTDHENAVITAINKLEKAAHKWQDAEARKLNRAEQNAVGYNDIGQLTTMTGEEIEATMQARKMGRIITAEFCVDESDSQTDYWGGRCARTVVIGFGKGKRENFRQLRKAAGDFPPTAHMGPGLGIFTPRVVILEAFKSNGAYYYEGSYSHWHSELDNNGDLQFSTREEAEAYTREKGEPSEIHFDGSQAVQFGWEVNETSYEHRECYSMGGGNYLGAGRYSGWRVSSATGLSTSRKHEVWEGVASRDK